MRICAPSKKKILFSNSHLLFLIPFLHHFRAPKLHSISPQLNLAAGPPPLRRCISLNIFVVFFQRFVERFGFCGTQALRCTAVMLRPPNYLKKRSYYLSIKEFALDTVILFNASRFLLALKMIQLITETLMGTQNKSTSSRALEGLHGVTVVSDSQFVLEKTTRDGEFSQLSCGSSAISVNQPLIMQWVWEQRPSCLRPVGGCIQGDRNLAERVANVLTSLPFIALGIQAPRKNFSMKLYANSLIGVGVASSLYHSSSGKLRQYLRWADYTMIATATVCLTGALKNDNPKLLMAASALLLPLRPFTVSALHTGMMEVIFAKRALKDPDLRMAHNVHKMSTLLGGVLFIADDAMPKTPFIHAAWHLAAAVGVGTCNKLLE